MIKKSVQIRVICSQKNFTDFALKLPEFKKGLYFKLNFKLETTCAPD